MLGNDIVDLRDSDSRPESFRARFDARVFSAEERRAIARDADPLARRWAHWAAKEATYKLAKQVDADFVFSPSRLVADFEAIESDIGRRLERRGVVRSSCRSELAPAEVEVRSFETEERIHVVALPIGADWGAVDMAVERIDAISMNSSIAVRQLAIREISRSLGIEPSRLSVGRLGSKAVGWQGGAPRSELGGATPSRVPTVELDGVQTSLSLSLSHHGRFISFAMMPRLEPAIHAGRQRDQPAIHTALGAMRP